MKHIALLASGQGTNAENIADYFANNDAVEVSVLLTDKQDAPVVNKMQRKEIEVKFFPRPLWREQPQLILDLLAEKQVDLIVLAGFTSFIDAKIVDAYEHRIINIHPSLLPKFGGKGMWGMNVHRAVVEAGEEESGITIHYVTNVIDGGGMIAQYKCAINKNDTPETVAEKVHALEYRYYPEVIASLLAD